MPLLPFLKRTLLALACLLCLQDLALASVSWRDIASGETDARVAALRAALLESNPRLAPFVEALLEDRVRVSPAGVWVIDGEAVRDFGADLAAVLPADAEDVSNNNRMRRELGVALAVLQLRSPRLAQRQAAVQVLQEQADNKHQAMIEQAWLHESDEPLKAQLQTLRASLLLAAPLASDRALAAKWLAAQGSPKVSALLEARLAVEPDAAVRAQLALAAGLAWGERLGL
jgi:urea transport system permease protein